MLLTVRDMTYKRGDVHPIQARKAFLDRECWARGSLAVLGSTCVRINFADAPSVIFDCPHVPRLAGLIDDGAVCLGDIVLVCQRWQLLMVVPRGPDGRQPPQVSAHTNLTRLEDGLIVAVAGNEGEPDPQLFSITAK